MGDADPRSPYAASMRRSLLYGSGEGGAVCGFALDLNRERMHSLQPVVIRIDMHSG